MICSSAFGIVLCSWSHLERNQSCSGRSLVSPLHRGNGFIQSRPDGKDASWRSETGADSAPHGGCDRNHKHGGWRAPYSARCHGYVDHTRILQTEEQCLGTGGVARLRTIAPASSCRRIRATLRVAKLDNDAEEVARVRIRGGMREARGAEANRSHCRTIRTRRFVPEGAERTCVAGENARDIQVVPVHRRGLSWWDIEQVNSESVRSKQYPALGYERIWYDCLLGVSCANAQSPSSQKPCDNSRAQIPPRSCDWYGAT